MSGTAHNCHEKVLDADVQIEGSGVDKALQVRVHPPGKTGQQSRQDKYLDTVTGCVYAHAFRHHATCLERANGTTLPGIKEVMQSPQA